MATTSDVDSRTTTRLCFEAVARRRIPVRYVGGFTTFRAAFPDLADQGNLLIEWCKEFRQGAIPEKGWHLWGGVGRGKTGLAFSVASELICRGFEVEVWTFAEFISGLRASFDKKNEFAPSEKEIFERAVKADLLIVDDLGAERIRAGSDFALSALQEIVDRRYRDMKPIIVTSNFSLGVLYSKFAEVDTCGMAERILSRFQEMLKAMEITGSDKRAEGSSK